MQSLKNDYNEMDPRLTTKPWNEKYSYWKISKINRQEILKWHSHCSEPSKTLNTTWNTATYLILIQPEKQSNLCVCSRSKVLVQQSGSRSKDRSHYSIRNTHNCFVWFYRLYLYQYEQCVQLRSGFLKGWALKRKLKYFICKVWVSEQGTRKRDRILLYWPNYWYSQNRNPIVKL